MLTQRRMCAHVLNVMVVVIVSDIVGNEENCIVKIVGVHLNLIIEEHELEIDPVDNMSIKRFHRSMRAPRVKRALSRFLDNPLLINVIFS